MTESRTIHDPFLGKNVEISDREEIMISREELLKQLLAMPSSLNDACRTMELAADFINGEIGHLYQCISMAMGCLDAESENPDERLAWLRLLDGMEGREPRSISAHDGLTADEKLDRARALAQAREDKGRSQ